MLQIIFKALNFLVQDSPGGSGAQGDLSISNGFKSVHPSGHPINHSTHTGFRCPPTIVLSICATTPKPGDFLFPDLSPSFQSLACGVGNFFSIEEYFTCIVRLLNPFFLSFLRLLFILFLKFSGVSSISNTLGVSHISCRDPDSIPLMVCANVVCSQHSPSRIKPHRGQVSENGSKSPRSEHW